MARRIGESNWGEFDRIYYFLHYFGGAKRDRALPQHIDLYEGAEKDEQFLDCNDATTSEGEILFTLNMLVTHSSHSDVGIAIRGFLRFSVRQCGTIWDGILVLALVLTDITESILSTHSQLCVSMTLFGSTRTSFQIGHSIIASIKWINK